MTGFEKFANFDSTCQISVIRYSGKIRFSNKPQSLFNYFENVVFSIVCLPLLFEILEQFSSDCRTVIPQFLCFWF